MLKTKFGPITNDDTGESKDIIVSMFAKAVRKEVTRDAFIGGGIVMLGIGYLAISMFKNGALAYDRAECDTLGALHLFIDE
jgi:hypothetical protein